MADSDDDYNETGLRDKFKSETRAFGSNSMRDFDFEESESDHKVTTNQRSSSENEKSPADNSEEKLKAFHDNINPPSPTVNNEDEEEDEQPLARFASGYKARQNTGGAVSRPYQARRQYRNDYDSNRFHGNNGGYSDFKRKYKPGNFRNDNNDSGGYRSMGDRLSNGRFNRNHDDGDGRYNRNSFGGMQNRRRPRNSISQGDHQFSSNAYNTNNNSLMVRSGVDNFEMVRAFSFKEFVITLDDSVQPKEAVLKYSEYTKNFINKEFPQFFERIKNFETVQIKYHPVYKDLYFNFNRKCLLFRLNCFLTLYLNGYLEGFSLDSFTTTMKEFGFTNYIAKDTSDLDDDSKLQIEESVKAKLPDSSLMKMHYLLLILANILLEMGTLDEVEQAKNEVIDMETQEISPEQIKNYDEDSDDNMDEKPGSQNSDQEMDNGNVKIKVKIGSSKTSLTEPIVEGRHNVLSIFVKNIPNSVTMDQIYKNYSSIDGFLRVYLPESFTWNKYFRRAYFTFKSGSNRTYVLDDINSKNLDSLEDKKHFISGISISTQKRHVLIKNPDSNHVINKTTLLYDARMVLMIIRALDDRYKLYDSSYQLENDNLYIVKTLPVPTIVDDGTKTAEELKQEAKALKFTEADLFEKQPVDFLDPLPEIADFEFDFTQFSENQIALSLETALADFNSNNSEDIDCLKSILDIAIFYLRMVHSIDYYGLNDYPNEHMRNIRLSTITLRPIQLPWAHNKIDLESPTDKENLSNYSEEFEEKFSIYKNSLELSDEEAKELGAKNVESEIEAYIKTNVDVTNPEKCLCILSNKRFKAFAYARKHILTNFQLALKKVELDTLFQNNFIKDRLHKIPNVTGWSATSSAGSNKNNSTDFALNLNSMSRRNRSGANNDNYSGAYLENKHYVDSSIEKIQRMMTQYTDLDAPDFD